MRSCLFSRTQRGSPCSPGMYATPDPGPPLFNGKCFSICLYNFATAFSVLGPRKFRPPGNGGLCLAGNFLFCDLKWACVASRACRCRPAGGAPGGAPT